MEEYECERCGVIFNTKKNLVQHLKKIVKCIGINSEKTQEELLEELNKKEGLECEACKKVYKNEESLRVHIHRCKGLVKEKDEVIAEIEKRIKYLQKELKDEVKMKQEAKSIVNNNDNSTTNNNINTTNNDNSTNNITNNITNITLVMNDIDSIHGIDYLLKEPKFLEKILKWVTDKNGLIKYMDEKYYNPKRPENRGIRKVDKDSIELRMDGDWRKCDNITALGAIINSMRMDWDNIIGSIRYDYDGEYENNKNKLVRFKREVSDPLDMDLDITDDEEEKDKGGVQMVYVEEKKKYVDEVIVEKGKEWKEKIIKNVK